MHRPKAQESLLLVSHIGWIFKGDDWLQSDEIYSCNDRRANSEQAIVGILRGMMTARGWLSLMEGKRERRSKKETRWATN